MVMIFKKPSHVLYFGIVLGSVLGTILGLESGNFLGDFLIGLLLGTALGYYTSLSTKGPLNEPTLSHLESLRIFPFKYMMAIIEIMNNDTDVTLGQIRKVSGACTTDARETLEMMEYLTVQGQIINTNGIWKRIPNNIEDLVEPRRVSYISTILNLMNNLDTVGRSLDELSRRNIVPSSNLEEYLLFLSVLTSKGIVRKK